MSSVDIIKQVRNPQGKMVPLIDVESLRSVLKPAQKTKSIRAIPTMLAAPYILRFIEVTAIEGNEKIHDSNSWICLGVDDEPWVQSSKAIFKGYDCVGLDEEGIWLVFEPKPEDERMAVLVDQFPDGFAIYGEWGDSSKDQDGFFPGGDKKRFIQFSSGTDGVVVTREDSSTDWWIVVPHIFERTYEFNA